LGPASYFLGRGGPYRKDIINKAAPLLETLSAGINETVLLAIRHGKKRLVLCTYEGNQEVKISSKHLFMDDFYSTATGNLLLANMPESDREAYVAGHGLPSRAWPEADTKKKMDQVLTAIRAEGRVIRGGAQIVQLAFAIKENDRILAAIGIPVPKFRFEGEAREKILREAGKTAEKISEMLSV
jgi:DNA-binding IclR family transcriptional regulator